MGKARLVMVLLAAGALLAGTLAVAQPGGGGRGRGGGMRGGMIMGTVTEVDVANSIIKADAFGQQVELYPVQATVLTKRIPLDIKDLKVGDRVDASGLPVKILAGQLTADRGPQPQNPAPPGGPGGPGGGGRPFGGGTNASVRGTVSSLEPLTISATIRSQDGTENKADVDIQLEDNATITQLVQAQWEEVVVGATFRGTTQMNQDQKLVLQTLVLGEQLPNMGGMGGGR